MLISKGKDVVRLSLRKPSNSLDNVYLSNYILTYDPHRTAFNNE